MSKKRNTSLEVSRRGNSAVINVKMEKQLESQPVNRTSAFGWVRWGSDNKYPSKLADLYYQGDTHKSCIDFAVTAVLGGGVDYEAMAVDSGDVSPNYQYDWDTLLEAVALDYMLYGGYAIQIIRNKDGRTYSFYHQPFADVRCSEKNEDGVVETYFVCSDWTKTSTNPPVELQSFTFVDADEIKSGQPYLYVYMPYAPEVTYYPVPRYIAAMKYIQCEAELARFDLRSVTNNFSASGILTLPEPDNEEDRKLAIDNIKAMFTGSDAANTLVVNFSVNGEEEAVKFTKLDKDAGNNVNLFNQLNDRIIAKICAAHRVSNKCLVGYEAESAMLGGEGNIMNKAIQLYEKLVASKDRRSIVSVLNKALAMNGVKTELILKPLRLDLDNTTTTTTTNSGDATGNDESERATNENNGSTE